VRCGYEAVLFDVDGTLVDSRVPVERAWLVAAEEFGVDPDPLLADCHGHRTEETARDYFPAGLQRQVVARVDALELSAVNGIRATAGAAELLARLPEGRWAAVTSGGRRLMTARLRSAGLPVPHVLIAAEDVTRGKPDPEGYLLAAARLGFEAAACLVVEDAPVGIRAGRAAGATVAVVTTTYPAARLESADLIVGSLEELGLIQVDDPTSGGPLLLAPAWR
jgi:sugar-phosphatase